ncbi:hypothetical protein CYMTET_53650 [Cymbomonas tetramitiformis]|uniref:RING-type domain-containing protein n=1 Tax=Cymbomonas tetramitiformis TaxID=36881 RepID=A0AAE0BHZ8_9CHLO|nr:hypothetical protein CYMTET_53650 [Cymbomonas tetramitiformis]
MKNVMKKMDAVYRKLENLLQLGRELSSSSISAAMAELNDWRNELSTEHNMLIGVTFTDSDSDRMTIRLGLGHNAPGLEKHCNGNFLRAVTLLQFNPSSAYLTDQTGLGAHVPRGIRGSLKQLCEQTGVPWWEGCVSRGTPLGQLPRLILSSNGVGDPEHSHHFLRLVELRLREQGRQAGPVYINPSPVEYTSDFIRRSLHVLRTARIVIILDANTSCKRGKEQWIANGERLLGPGPFNISTLPQLRSHVASATGICLKQLIQAGGFNAADQAEAVTAINEADVLWVVGGSVCRLIKSLRMTGAGGPIAAPSGSAAMQAPAWWMYKLLDAGVVYYGISAGSIVTGESIETMFWKGRMRIGGERDAYLEEHAEALQDLSGLRLFPGKRNLLNGTVEKISLLPHAQSTTAAQADLWTRHLNHHCYKLTDSGPARALLVEGHSVQYIPSDLYQAAPVPLPLGFAEAVLPQQVPAFPFGPLGPMHFQVAFQLGRYHLEFVRRLPTDPLTYRVNGEDKLNNVVVNSVNDDGHVSITGIRAPGVDESYCTSRIFTVPRDAIQRLKTLLTTTPSRLLLPDSACFQVSFTDTDNDRIEFWKHRLTDPLIYRMASLLPTAARKECIICHDEQRQVALPCGHFTMCLECAQQMFHLRASCPTCNVPFSAYHIPADHLTRSLSFDPTIVGQTAGLHNFTGQRHRGL